MTKRRLRKLARRLSHLPGGRLLPRYAMNKVRQLVLALFRSTHVAYPSNLMLELTNHCNLKCTTCPREHGYGQQMDEGRMPFAAFKAIIDEVHPYLDSLGLTGLGETLLYKDLQSAIEYIRGKCRGIVIFISTNAHVARSADLIAPMIGKIDTVQISIDGTEEVYSRIRIKGDFAIFRENVREIVALAEDSTTDVMLNMVVCKENYAEMKNVLHFAHTERIRYVNITHMNVVGLPEYDESYYRFFESPEFQAEATEARKVARDYPEIEFTCPSLTSDTGSRWCTHIWRRAYITWDGSVPPCCAKPSPNALSFGNGNADGGLETLNSESFRAFRSSWLRGVRPDFCRNC